MGAWIARFIGEWLSDPPTVPEPPAIRAGFHSFADARALLAGNPDWSDVRADLQMHTRETDGAASLEDMVRGAATYGYEYVAITDHSKGLAITNGMDEGRLAAQGRAIAALDTAATTSGGVRVLRAIEMNLSPEGVEDMERPALAELDLVLGAFHSKLRTKEDQTERYLKALANPTVNVLAHPRGRIYNFRLGLAADWRRVAERAAEVDKALEIDAYPDRQDLDVDLLRVVAQAGGRVSIGTDAHNVEELRFLPLGVAAAIRAGIPRARILNFMPREDLIAWARKPRAA